MRSTCELIQGLRKLTSIRVHNPDAQSAADGRIWELDMESGRGGLDPFDPHAYCAYALCMPPSPKVPVQPDRGYHWHFQHVNKEIVGRKNDFVYDPATAAWLEDLKAQEAKAKALEAKAAKAAEVAEAKAAAQASSSSGAGPSSLMAPDLRPLEPTNAKGRRVLVPRSTWPEYTCTEQGGSGWAASVKSCNAKGVAKVQFESAVDDEGRPYPDEYLTLDSLRPL